LRQVHAKMNVMASTWFITGTSSGLGRKLTEQLLQRGDRVAATLRRADALDDLRAAAGDRLWVAALDVTDADQVRATVDRAFAELGTIDVVVNNAGYGAFGSVEEVDDAEIERVVDTNLFGPIRVVRAALPHLRRQGHGRIVQVSTAGGQTTYPSFGYYHAAKWGLEGFSETLAQEVAPFGIGVTIVEPGATPTGFGTGLAQSAPMAEYATTPAGDVRRAIAEGAFPIPNDPDRVVAAMIAAAETEPAPLRVPLGTDAYDDVRASYVARLEEHDRHREIARGVAVTS
jgi:NAD(P)-dependent dehydrogenase (short-subunit alcohol dehydrogenase family)